MSLSLSHAACRVSRVTERSLTHWGRVTHLCVGNITIIGSDNGLSPGRRQAIFSTNDGILLIGPLETNFNEISIEMQTFSFKKMCLKVSSAKRRPFCLSLNVLTDLLAAAKIYFQIPEYILAECIFLFLISLQEVLRSYTTVLKLCWNEYAWNISEFHNWLATSKYA